MSKKLLGIYEEALERIRDMTHPDAEAVKASDLHQIVLDTLAQGEKDNEAEKVALILALRDFVLSNGLMFDTAEELAEKLNADGSITTIRGKQWSKATIARLMPEIRAEILKVTAKVAAVPLVATPSIDKPVLSEPELVEAIQATPVSTIEDQIVNELVEVDELAELEGLLTDA